MNENILEAYNWLILLGLMEVFVPVDREDLLIYNYLFFLHR